MGLITKQELANLLVKSTEPVELKFKKANGETRFMSCTLNPSLIPLDLIAGMAKAKVAEHLLTVYDLEEDAWRMVNFTSAVELV